MFTAKERIWLVAMAAFCFLCGTVAATCRTGGYVAPIGAYGGAGLSPTVLHPRPGCTFTWDVSEIDLATIAEPLRPERACTAYLMRSVSVTGSRSNLTVVLGYAVDLKGTPVAGTPTAVGALKNAVAAWSVWRYAFGGVSNFTLKFQDAKGRDLCWFFFSGETGDTGAPIVNQCVKVVK